MSRSRSPSTFFIRVSVDPFRFGGSDRVDLHCCTAPPSRAHQQHEQTIGDYQRIPGIFIVEALRYLPPQIYNSIFSGRNDATIRTERKKLTIFFSDIADFTPTTEQL